MKLTVMTAELPDERDIRVATAAPGGGRIGALGMRVEALDDAQRETLGVEEGGVLVAEVGEGPAANAGVRKGDVVLMLDNEAVEDVAGFASAARKLPSGKAVSILIQRDGNPLFLALKAR